MEEAAARKERLRALRQAAAAEGAQQDEGQAPTQQEEPEKPVLKFRNYLVHDQKNIEHQQIAPAQPPKFEEPVVEKRVEEVEQQELLASVAPKKANFDLKRDVQPALDKLERRTQKALLEILRQKERERIEQEGGIQD